MAGKILATETGVMCSHMGSNRKVKVYYAKREFVELLVQKHWDVYQEGIVFYKVTQSFAKGFSLENCSAVKDPTNKDLYIVAWAPFAERAMKSSEEHCNSENKPAKGGRTP